MKNNFYTYIILDPRFQGPYKFHEIYLTSEPYYVGKGSNDRIISTLKNKRQKIKYDRTQQILNSGFEPIVIKILENVTELEAFRCEEKLIEQIGRENLKRGPLLNKTNGSEGKSGHVLSDKTKKLMSSSRKGPKHWKYGKKDFNKFEVFENKEVKVYLSQNMYCMVDLKNWINLKKYKWYVGNFHGKYHVISQEIVDGSLNKKTLYMYSLIKKSDLNVLFIDGNSLNLLEKNLKYESLSKIQSNRKIGKNSVSGVKGVYWSNVSKKWGVRISIDKKKRFFGSYFDLKDAEAKALEIYSSLS
jgi:LEM3-like protein/NUMOD3 motif-containing protein